MHSKLLFKWPLRSPSPQAGLAIAIPNHHVLYPVWIAPLLGGEHGRHRTASGLTVLVFTQVIGALHWVDSAGYPPGRRHPTRCSLVRTHRACSTQRPQGGDERLTPTVQRPGRLSSHRSTIFQVSSTSSTSNSTSHLRLTSVTRQYAYWRPWWRRFARPPEPAPTFGRCT